MKEFSKPLKERLLDFAVKVILQLKRIPDDREFRVVRYQLSKAATSIGANYSEALGAGTKKDFINKVQISLKEAYESEYWIELIRRIDPADDRAWEVLQNECRQLIAILSRTLITSKENLSKSKTRHPD